MSEAVKPLTVPRELLGPPGDFNPTLLMFLAAILLLLALVFVVFLCYEFAGTASGWHGHP
jgi:beta-carotene hydroxylase